MALLCLQNFFVGGSMASKVKGNGPALKALHMLLLGENLSETITLNCLDEELLSKTAGALGRPVWESAPDNNLLARLAPTPCALWLTDDLSRIFIEQGHQYLAYEAYRDPYVTTEKVPNKDEKRLLRARPSQGIWRDLHLLTSLDKSSGDDAPLVLQGLRERQELKNSTRLWVGELIKAKDAKIEDNTESTFTVPKSLFTSAGNHLYETGIAHAETMSKKLWGAIKTHGSSLKNEHPPIAEGQKHFWHALDQRHRALIQMVRNPDDYKEKFGSPGATDPWSKLVQQAALDAYMAVCSRTTPRQIQAYAAGMKSLRKQYTAKKTTTKKTAKLSSQSELPLKS
jgi:CRISPR system Cascade subunit CasA